MSDNSSHPGRPLTRREIREREEAAAQARAAATGAPHAQASPAPSSPPSRRSLHSPRVPDAAAPPVVRPPSSTGGFRQLDETGRLTPVQRGGGRPVPATPAVPAPRTPVPPARTSLRGQGGPSAPSSSAPSSPFAPSWGGQSPFGQPGAVPRPAASGPAPSGPAPSGPPPSAPASPTPGLLPTRSTGPAPASAAPPSVRPDQSRDLPGSPVRPGAPTSAGTAPASPWGRTSTTGVPEAAPGGTGAWGSITRAAAAPTGQDATAGETRAAAQAMPGSLPPANPQPSPFDAVVTPQQRLRTRAESAAPDGEDEEIRPSSYTWLHYIILVVVAFVLGWLLWQLLDSISYAPDAEASAAVSVVTTLNPSRGPL